MKACVIVDIHEGRSDIAAALEHLGVEVRMRAMAVADAETMRGLTLAVADQGVVVLRSIDQHDSARWIAGLARRRQARVARDRPPYAQRLRSPCTQPGEALVGAIDGISVHHARALLASFGSVQHIVTAEREDWMAVRGIGPARARAMALAFGTELTHQPSSAAQEEGSGSRHMMIASSRLLV